KLRVFLCHAKEDKPTVREICNLLNDEGWIKAWLDEDELLPGQNWDLEIKRAVKQSDIVLVCLSNKTVQKDGYVQKEIRYVIDVAEEKPEDKIFVIPVRMNDCLVPQRLQCWQWVDYFPKQNQDKAYKRLIESLKLSASRLEIPTGHPYKQFYTPINQSHVVNYLIGRQMQLEMFGRILDRINHESPISSNIFEWYGSPGIGKSTLVSMLANQAHEKHALHAIIDFRKLTSGKAKAYLHDPIVLIEDIVSALESQISLDTREFDSALMEYRSISLPQEGVAFAYDRLDQEARLYNRPRWLTALRDIVIAFIKLINLLRSQTGINQRKPFVLFFDETEYIDVEFVDWLEEW
ncbi:MAG: TIR domain-containing protein, partial [Thermoanaerobaculia bacterium]|nr:TIR domain-containing protein [Thermoanaerobaculia bacterium]